jgi:two-component system capsular synthesis sensor histidine kinase RcsC
MGGQHMEALLANVGHEFRTPLASLVAALEIIEDETDLDPVQARMVAAMGSSVRRLTDLVETVVDFSEVQAGRRRPEARAFDPAGLTAELVSEVQLRTDAGRVSVGWTVGRAVPHRVVGDADGARRVLQQLLDNAVKFTDRGRIEVTVDHVTQGPVVPALLFVVQDTGIGFSAEHRRHIFEPFTQVDGSVTRRYGGAGLGLALCDRLVAQIGGRLWCEGDPGAGSRFSFLLPLGRQVPSSAPESARQHTGRRRLTSISKTA